MYGNLKQGDVCVHGTTQNLYAITFSSDNPTLVGQERDRKLYHIHSWL